ncbi:hypothetical protein GCM10011390_41640 [Aureimonas endophytica]|uniref:Uncharacterized protein n=1 Tax=Aureimonas endophytica TaxID=2027858 RepID=A0A917EB99_9HYPH|nr:hypothetical protein [Aureimonas endophytica]GGE18123.1 hypothetical protein GCM10011390_41640 [Aureimonas endophytica]
MSPGTETWLSAFWEISSERQIGMGLGQVPGSAIDRWAAKLGVAEPGMFRACIRAMDGVYLDHANKRPDEEDVIMPEPRKPGTLGFLLATAGK